MPRARHDEPVTLRGGTDHEVVPALEPVSRARTVTTFRPRLVGLAIGAIAFVPFVLVAAGLGMDRDAMFVAYLAFQAGGGILGVALEHFGPHAD